MLSENDKQVQALNKELKDTEEQAKACASKSDDMHMMQKPQFTLAYTIGSSITFCSSSLRIYYNTL